MGRERQKFKKRSSVSKVKHKPKSKKKLLQNPIIAANWNQKETLSQNYKRLGLTSRLNHPTGGTDKPTTTAGVSPDNPDSDEPSPHVTAQELLNINRRLPRQLHVSEARVERDPTTGAILSVIESDEKDGKSKKKRKKKNPLSDPLNDLEGDSDSDSGEGWVGFVNEHGVVDGAVQRRRRDGTRETATETVRRLEEEADRRTVKRTRVQSEREREWVERLVGRHGEDYRAMSRDLKLNVMQQSEGDIRRRVLRWKKARGMA